MIGLSIRVIKGHSAGQETDYQFDAEHHTSIVVGCDAQNCDVVLAAANLDKGVGQEHIGFKRSLGAYELDLNTQYYVGVDGKPAFEGKRFKG